MVFLLPIITYASCSEKEANRFDKIKDNFKIEYTLNESKYNYKVVLHNPEPSRFAYEMKLIENSESFSMDRCKAEGNNDIVCESVDVGGYTINVVGITETCNDTLKRTFLRLKPYNKYSEDPLCNDIKEFTLCQETYEKEIDYDTFVTRVNIYKEQKAEEEKNAKKKFFDFQKIKNFIEDNLYETIVIAAFVVIVIITIIVSIITYKKSRRLE